MKNTVIFDLDGLLIDSEAGIQAAFSAGIEVICIPDMKVPGENFYKMAAAVLSSLKDVISWLENDNKKCRFGNLLNGCVVDSFLTKERQRGIKDLLCALFHLLFPDLGFSQNQHLPCTYFVIVIRSHFQNNVNTLCVITSAGQAAFCLD